MFGLLAACAREMCGGGGLELHMNLSASPRRGLDAHPLEHCA